MEKSTLEIYNTRVNALDDLVLINFENYKDLKYHGNDWKKTLIYSYLIQSTNIVKSILRDLPGSKHICNKQINEITIVGSSTRLIFDIFIKLIYLKYCKKPNDQMYKCWEFQRIQRLIKISEHEIKYDLSYSDIINSLIKKEDELRSEIKSFPDFFTKDKVLDGMEEKMINHIGIATLINVDPKKIDTDFIYLSQFSHSTSFATDIRIRKNTLLSLIPILDKLCFYFFGITYEVLEIHNPKFEHIQLIKDGYFKGLNEKWK